MDFLPKKFDILKTLDLTSVSEIRFRVGFPVFVVLLGKKIYISDSGTTLNKDTAIICKQDDVVDIINNATERSLYAFNDRIKQGYITTKAGVRVGIAGECVFQNGRITTIKSITSLNIRIPHEIKNCSEKIFNKLFLNELPSVLIVSPPAKGKTTILKDLARKLNIYTDYSILIVDERGEFENVTGENIDVIKYSDKAFALNYAIRTLSPQIIITDELQTKNDWDGAKNAILSGVKLIASCHGKGLSDLIEKDEIKIGLFDYYVILDSDKSAGTVKEFFDKSLKLL